VKIKIGTVEAGPKRVRVLKGGRIVADSTAVRLVWENHFYPTYFFPTDDVDFDALDESDVHRAADDEPGGGRSTPIVKLTWDAMDAWFEEDEEVIVHPRSPYVRVDALRSSRAVRVELDGVTIAESCSAVMLFETDLPTRYYLPKTDVHMDLLNRSEVHTGCPYKGVASYYDVRVNGKTHDALAWWYPSPLPESAPVAGLVCFYNEKVDLFIGGEPLRRPSTKFS
jgi:uncharacterized protein (DUF427 family)